MTLKPKYSRLLEISSGWHVWGMVKDYCLDRVFGFWGKGEMVF
jgi:hypothetical protein